MGFILSILLKIILYLVFIGILHYFIRYIQKTFTTSKRRIIANDQLLYSDLERKLKESDELNVKQPPPIEHDDISTTMIDQIPTQLNEPTTSFNPYTKKEPDMKEQLKNFLHDKSTPNPVSMFIGETKLSN